MDQIELSLHDNDQLRNCHNVEGQASKVVLVCLAVLIGYIGGLVGRSKGEDKLAERDAQGGSSKGKQKPLDRIINFVLVSHAARAVRHVIALGVLMALVVVVVQQLVEYGDCTYLDL